MNASAPQQINTIFHAAIEIDSPEERREFLQRACGGDPQLQRQAERLIEAHFRGGSIIDAPAHVAIATLDEPPVEKPGTLIGPYKILEQIGEGGMGLVYMAEQQRPVRRLVALKIIKPGMDSKQTIARFEAERQALALMDHPNIAKVLDAGTTETGRAYFVMELVRGLPLNEFCDEKRLDVRQRLELFIQVCQAVQHAHQKGIIHRDLKPTNVLVTMHDSTSVPMIIDFGIAKALGQQLTELTLHTGYAQLIGTPLYMSPEQAEMNQLGVDTRSDVYSLGVMLYELLTGTTPFDKEALTKNGIDEMRKIIREQEPPRPSTRLSTLQAEALSTISTRRSIDPRRISMTLRGELDWIVMKALEKDRSERYESVSGLARDIQHYLNDETVQACPPSAAYRFRKFARKNRASLTTAAIVAASLLIGTGISIWQAIRATAAEAQAKASEAKANTEEQKALAAAVRESAQRQEAEKSLESALEAVGRMLANVNDEELNELPRIGALRRKQLKDAVDFIQRIPISPHGTAAIRFQLAQTWHKVAELQVELDESEQAIKSYQASIDTLSSLVAEQPQDISYRDALANAHSRAGWAFFHGTHSFSSAEESFRHASELYAKLRQQEPKKQSWVIRQSRQLCGLSAALTQLSRRTEALHQALRALELAESVKDPVQSDCSRILQQIAVLRFNNAPDESRDLYRRSIDCYRAHLARHNLRAVQLSFAERLDVTAGALSERYPDDAEKYWDESIELWRKVCGPTPRVRNTAALFVRALLGQSRLLRHRARHESSANSSAPASDRILKAESLYQEALTHQRSNISRFQLVADRFQLVDLLREEAQYLLDNLPKMTNAADSPNGDQPRRRPEPRTASPAELQADSCLTEAIQFCRALATEFPDNADYKNRLDALLKLQAQHFGQQPESKSEKVPNK